MRVDNFKNTTVWRFVLTEAFVGASEFHAEAEREGKNTKYFEQLF
jgi:hypothetical protein